MKARTSLPETDHQGPAATDQLNWRPRTSASRWKRCWNNRERPVRIQSAADAPRDPMPRDRYAESQTPTRAHHEQRRDVALQRATRRQRKPEPRYVEPPPGTPPPPDGEPPPTPRGEVRIPQEASQRSSRMRRARDEQSMRDET